MALGIANLLTPTNAALVAYSEYCGISYLTWLKHTWKLLVVFTVMSLIIIIIVGGMLYGGIFF
jgi:uncharacterized ion transporter superfamily protein YfcC